MWTAIKYPDGRVHSIWRNEELALAHTAPARDKEWLLERGYKIITDQEEIIALIQDSK